MIKSLSLKNWKSFGYAVLWVDPLTFVIGANSAGKSNIVDALAFLSYAAAGNRIPECSLRGGAEGFIKRNQDRASLSIAIVHGKEEFEFNLSLSMCNKELMVVQESLILKSASGKKKFLYTTDEPEVNSDQIVARFMKDKAGPPKGLAVKRDITILSQIPNLNVIKDIKEKAEIVASSLKSISVLDPKPDMMRGYSPLSDKLASDGSNIAGVIADLPDSLKKNFESKLTDYVKPLPEKDLIRIWAEPVGRFKTDAMLYCAEEWIDGDVTEFDARSMSDGTLRFVAIVSALLTAQKGSTIVIEEVDNGLHPSRTGELVAALKNLGASNEIDIVCTTHNPVLIDALGPQMLPFISFVSRSEMSGNSEIHLLEDVPHLLRLLAKYSPGEMMTNGLLSSETK